MQVAGYICKCFGSSTAEHLSSFPRPFASLLQGGAQPGASLLYIVRPRCDDASQQLKTDNSANPKPMANRKASAPTEPASKPENGSSGSSPSATVRRIRVGTEMHMHPALTLCK